jgi:glycosyltransferase involved in cell wall biosynthesis
MRIGLPTSAKLPFAAIPMIVHVLPLDLPRGAQSFARALCDELGPDHKVLTLFDSDPAVLRADLALEVPDGRLRRAGFDPRAALRLRRALRRQRPRLVVAHGGEALKYTARARPAGTPLVYLKIGLTGPLLRGRVQLALLRAAARRAEAVVCVSQEMAEEARELLRLPASRVACIPNARDPRAYRPGPPRPAEAVPKLAWVGQLNRAKRPEAFCAAVHALRDRGRSLEAVMVGDGPLLDSLRASAGSAGVELLGRQDDVPAILAGSDLLVFSGGETEGMPGVLIEAGMCGIPAVTTEVPGARAVVEDGVTGFVVGIGEAPALAERVDRLLGDIALRRRMGAAARERCERRFSITASASGWQELIDSLGERARGTAPEGAIDEALGVE